MVYQKKKTIKTHSYQKFRNICDKLGTGFRGRERQDKYYNQYHNSTIPNKTISLHFLNLENDDGHVNSDEEEHTKGL